MMTFPLVTRPDLPAKKFPIAIIGTGGDRERCAFASLPDGGFSSVGVNEPDGEARRVAGEGLFC